MLLSLQNISKTYTNQNGNIDRKVLNGLNLEVKGKERIAIVGSSGSGKTTLLNIIGTLDKPDHGYVNFRGSNLLSMNSKELSSFRNRQIGFVFQLHHLLPQCTLLENILIPTLPLQQKDKVSRERAEDLLRKVGLWGNRFQKPGELSGGECQRAAVVRALINNPQLLLADEPTGALDEENATSVIDLLIGFNESEKFSLIVVTHSHELAGKMDKIYTLKHGKLE